MSPFFPFLPQRKGKSERRSLSPNNSFFSSPPAAHTRDSGSARLFLPSHSEKKKGEITHDRTKLTPFLLPLSAERTKRKQQETIDPFFFPFPHQRCETDI